MKGAMEKKQRPSKVPNLHFQTTEKEFRKKSKENCLIHSVTTKASGSGSGFGLYNTKVFIEDHNGLIGFATKKEEGTTFFLFIPLETDEEEGSVNYLKRHKAGNTSI